MAKTCLERTIPLTMEDKMQSRTSTTRIVWNTRTGVYFPFRRCAVHLRFKI